MIYLHVPFCESFCVYCGFFSVVPSSRDRGPKGVCFDNFADAVVSEIEARRDEIAATLAVNTFYIGGGTPSVLPLNVLSRIVAAIRSANAGGGDFPARPFTRTGSRSAELAEVSGGGVSCLRPFTRIGSRSDREGQEIATSRKEAWQEFTIEVNPEDIVEKGTEYVTGLKDLGVNRISMGVQSFDDNILKWMNRRHNSAAADEAFHIIRQAGIENISVDLIFGLPQMTNEIWIDTIEKTLALAPEHISAYQLSIEKDSALDRLISEGKFVEADEDQCRRQYDILCSKLSEAGYRHYEISNFALPGREAVHNSAYWRRVPYVGLGPGAHSLSEGSIRSWNTQEIPRAAVDGSLRTYSREDEKLTPEDIRIERIMLPLRTDAGLPEKELRSLAGDETVERLLEEGALVRSGQNIRIPEDHFFTSDEIIRELI